VNPNSARCSRCWQKCAIVCSQTNGLCTNFVGFRASVQPTFNSGIEIELLVYWSKDENNAYDVETLVDQYNSLARKDGKPIGLHSEQFLTRLASVARNKDAVSQNLHANEQEERPGGQNNTAIDIGDEDPSLPSFYSGPFLKLKSSSTTLDSSDNDAPQSFKCNYYEKTFTRNYHRNRHKKDSHALEAVNCEYCDHFAEDP
jgi:hypothetical protein